jgi:hypothetical protein
VFSCVLGNQGTSQKPCMESNSKKQGVQKESKKKKIPSMQESARGAFEKL